MSLKSYKKASTQAIPYDQYVPAQVVAPPVAVVTVPQNRITMWSLLSGANNDLRELVQTSSFAGLIIPGIFIGIGVFLLGQQVVPQIDQKLKEISGYYNQGTTPLVAGEYIAERVKYLSDPGAEYFQGLTQNALKRNILQDDTTSNNFHGRFYLTIPSLGFNRLPIEANVESWQESSYNSVLKTRLAHFKGTGLPISDVQNNIVIYGHSGRANYRATPSDPEGAFTFLPDLKIGDEIFLEVEGKQYKFVMTRSKIVEPNDTEIITGSPGRRTLTLFTCYNGNNAYRYVAIARPV
jgi:LPXTG-site transpeptidase (sortase) family protein